MSTFEPCAVDCPACGQSFDITIARGLHITRLPAIRRDIVNGTFQRETCPQCGARTAFEATVVYTDFERGEYIATETRASASRQAAIARHQTIFRDCFEHGPPIARELGGRLVRRIVFGFEALREKLVLWDAGLDDRIVEAVKGDVIRRDGESPHEVLLRIVQILDGGHLLFAVYEPASPELAAASAPSDLVIAPAAMYRARAAAPAAIANDYPWLPDDWLVDLHHGPAYLYRP